ncbi:MAG: cell division protein FtsW [Candidatus Marinimicrobia bacterium]|nr:cell division protein FtsW [Candidatus Neomarinimicrobiota bacterium]
MIIRKYDSTLLISLLLLAGVGTIMLFSASSPTSLLESNNRTNMLYLEAHLKRLLIGIILMFATLSIDYRQLKRFAPGLMIGAILLLVLTKLLFIIKGNYAPARWIYIGSFSMQTSDIARLAVLIFTSYYLDKKRNQIQDFQTGLMPILGVLGLVMGLIVIQPDFSTAAMIGLIGVSIIFIGGAKLSHLSFAGAFSLLLAVPIILYKDYRRARILSWFGVGSTPAADYQADQSLISLGNGGWFGLGLGNSMEKNLFLPTPHTDFIFAIIGEELGIIGAVALLFLFLFIFHRGIKIAKNCTDPFGVFLAIGISFNIVLYAFTNAAVVTGIFPVTGLPMPLVSYGGSGMAINLVMFGLLLNISQARRSVSNKNGWSPVFNG